MPMLTSRPKTPRNAAWLAVSALWACQSALDLDDFTFGAGGAEPGGSAGNGALPSGAAGDGGADSLDAPGAASGASAGALGAVPGGGQADGVGADTGGPAASFDHYRFSRGSPAFAVPAADGLLANDRGENLAVLAGTWATERGGSVAIAADGSFTYSPPAAAFWGDDRFEYRLAANPGASGARVRISVQPGALTLADIELGAGNGFVIEGAAPQDFAGASVAGAGDVDDDGFADLALGAYGVDGAAGASAGAAYLVFGKPTPSPVSLAALDAADGFVASGAAANDFTGNALSRAGDVNGDGLPDVIVGAYRSAAAAGDNAGSAYVLFGKRDAQPVSLGALGAAGFGISGIGAGEFAASSVAGAGDVNGDGLDDVIVGVPGRSIAGTDGVGAAYVVFGKRDSVTVSLAAVEAGGGGFAITGNDAGDAAGTSVAGAGDVNGDGLADLALGASAASVSDSAVYVVFGKADGAAVSLAAIADGSGGFVVASPPAGLDVGRAVAGAGDVNGDGLDDLVVRGLAAYVVLGKADGAAIRFAELEAGQRGFAIGDETTADSVAGAGDVNGDGLDDVVLGLPDAIPGVVGRAFGKTCVVFGARAMAPVLLSELEPSAGFCIFGAESEDFSGQSVAAAGDVNRDGLGDIVTGAYQASPQGRGLAGSAYVLFGWDASDALGARHVALVGGSADDVFEPSAGEVVSVQGGGGVDTLRLPASQATLDLASRVPRLSSIEIIDLSNAAPSTLRLDDGSVRRLPRARPGLPAGLVKTLIVLGDSGDEVRLDPSDYERVGNNAGRELYRKRGTSYGLELAAGVALVSP
jgi:hypothetical protein